MVNGHDDVIVVEGVREGVPPGYHWQPRVGQEALGLLNARVPEHSRDEVQNSAVAVLGKCTPPTGEPPLETGLVVGYVQSGKTLSFTTVTALANDNDFQIVVVIAGTSVNLLEQSTGRLRRDLRLDEERRRKWQQFTNPDASDRYRRPILDVLEDWRDANTPRQDKQTVLITVMKQHQRLSNLVALLRSLDLTAVPVLIIDDEADQASLNTQVNQGLESTTYRQLMALRAALPRHTLLEYTATPQAPLLISIIDTLSPNFVRVLQPGPDYIGGRDFFAGADQRYVELIPPNEVPTNLVPLVEPPPTLIEAVRVFMVGVAAGLVQGGDVRNRSMLVHPSHRTDFHDDYVTWVRQIFENWKHIFSEAPGSQDKQELVEDFRTSYDDLAGTVADLPAFEAIVGTLPRAFRRTQILPVNAARGQTPEVPWTNAYGWILVGGQAMDRGFTVEGLTVTYMPRGVGVGNADTLQQRARFFGYKRGYLGYCRVYLEQATLRSFQEYVRHEEDIRGQLIEHERTGQSLRDWKRVFVLSPRLNPTRANVIQFDYIRGLFSDDWFYPKVVNVGPEVIGSNRNVVRQFMATLQLRDDEGHADRTRTMRHLVAENVRVQDVLEGLLIPLRVTGAVDAQRYVGLLLQVKRALEANPHEMCTVFQMSPTERRRRGITDEGEIKNAFQGAAPVSPRELRGTVYPGDQGIRAQDRLTVQLHEHDLTYPDEATVVAAQVPFVAVWVPARMAAPWVVQEQPQPPQQAA